MLPRRGPALAAANANSRAANTEEPPNQPRGNNGSHSLDEACSTARVLFGH